MGYGTRHNPCHKLCRHSPGGLLDSLEDSEGHRRDYLHDAVGRLSAIQAPGGERVRFVFDAGGRLWETAAANGYRAEYRYTAEGYPEEVLNLAAGGAEVSHHTYQYDPLGRRTGHLEAIAGAVTDDTYHYDALDRLREVRTNGGATLAEAFAYDADGNRREQTVADGRVERYVYGAAQQLKEIRSGSDTGAILASYTYDLAGNLTQRSGGGTNLALSYDALERLVAASGTGIAPETYAYDHQDRRIETTVDGMPRRSVYAGLEIWSEYGDAWTQAQAVYTDAGLDRPLLRTDAGGTAYYHADALGSVVAVTDPAGAILGSARYAAFGQTLAGGNLPRYGYTGREPDATGLIYYRARYYDPTIGRFTQRDPAGFADGLNPYAYVGNNPISFTDPLGLNKMAPIASSNVSGYPGYLMLADSGTVQSDAGSEGLLIGFGQSMRTLAPGQPIPEGAVSMNGPGSPLGGAETVLNLAPEVKGAVVLGNIGKVTKKVAVDAMARAAAAPDKGGLTRAGRSLDKHGVGQRSNTSPFPTPKGGVAEKNAMGQFQVEDLLTHPDAVFKPLGRGGMEVRVPDGRAMRFDADGRFAGFIE